jgi:hypothetical protein
MCVFICVPSQSQYRIVLHRSLLLPFYNQYLTPSILSISSCLSNISPLNSWRPLIWFCISIMLSFEKYYISCTCCHTPVTQLLWRWKRDDHEFEASLGVVRPISNIKWKQKGWGPFCSSVLAKPWVRSPIPQENTIWMESCGT